MKQPLPYFWLILAGAISVLVGVALTEIVPGFPWPAVVVFVALGQATLFAPRALLKLRMRALQNALDTEDRPRALVVVDKLERMSSDPSWRRHWVISRASLAALTEEYQEARAALNAIETAELPPLTRAVVLNDLAWAMAHDGAAEDALEIVERAIAASTEAGLPPSFASCCVGTKGVAELKAGRLEAARETLGRALAMGGSPRLIATRAFYLGETHLALGHDEDAVDAYRRAVQAMPGGRYGRRAAAALEAIAARQPYRG